MILSEKCTFVSLLLSDFIFPIPEVWNRKKVLRTQVSASQFLLDGGFKKQTRSAKALNHSTNKAISSGCRFLTPWPTVALQTSRSAAAGT